MKPGTVVAGRYIIEAFAGAGGMASVYKARDEEAGRIVALKVLQSQSLRFDKRFARESKMLHELRHPAIVRCFDSGITATQEQYLVMEWLEGLDLTTQVRQQPLSIAESLTLITRIASALEFIHARRVVHRDVKPANIFLPGGDVHAAKLLDFGVARWSGVSRSLTRPGVRFGTPAYMSPEQVRGVRHLNPRTDIFSLGCVLYECLTGIPAFTGSDAMAVLCKILVDQPPDVHEYLPTVPDQIVALLDRMMAKRWSERPKSTEVIAETGRLHDSLPSNELHARPRHTVDRRAITGSEQRLAHVVVAATSPEIFDAVNESTVWLREFHTLATLGSGQIADVPDRLSDGSGEHAPVPMEVIGAQSTAVGSSEFTVSPHQLGRIARALKPIGARFSVLGDGSIIAVLEAQIRRSPTARATAVDQVANAARCALRLREELPKSLVALATGRSLISNHQLVGQVVDRAIELLRGVARKEQAFLRGGEIRIDAVTRGLLGPRFELDGNTERGYLLLGERSTLHPPRTRGQQPFVGRARELRTLVETLDECIEDRLANVALVTGAAGFGKSRLRDEFLAHITDSYEEVDIWLAQADPVCVNAPLHVMANAIGYAAGIINRQPAALRRYQLRKWAQRCVAVEQLKRVTAFVSELLAVPPPLRRHGESADLSAARCDRKLMGEELRRACLDLLDATTQHRPVVVIIEDMQWADQATVEFLNLALRHMVERPLLVAAFGRPEIRDVFPNLWHEHSVTEIRLGRLPRRAAEMFVKTALGPHVPTQRVAALVERADGNALYLEELVRNAEQGNWSLPETIIAMLETRLSALDPQARKILRAASIFGDSFWLEGIVELVGHRDVVARWMKLLIHGNWIRFSPTSRFSDQSEYTFRSSLIREVAYAMLTEQGKRLGHRLAGAWLEQVGESRAHIIADHFDRGGEPARAVAWYLKAAREACNRDEVDAAVALAERGIACGAQGEALDALREIQKGSR